MHISKSSASKLSDAMNEATDLLQELIEVWSESFPQELVDAIDEAIQKLKESWR